MAMHFIEVQNRYHGKSRGGVWTHPRSPLDPPMGCPQIVWFNYAFLFALAEYLRKLLFKLFTSHALTADLGNNAFFDVSSNFSQLFTFSNSNTSIFGTNAHYSNIFCV